jgi:hypothetical protein
VHGQILAASNYQAETVIGIAADDSGDALDAADAAAIRFARKVVLEADKITQEDVDELHGPLPATSLLTCRDATHWCAVGGSVERPWAAKKRPARPDRLDAN